MSDKIARYRKLYPRIWRHPGFRASNKGTREVALYALTGPQTNRIGIFHFSLMTAADDLTVGVDTLRERVRDVTLTFGWLFDADARVLYIPSWWRWNPPENESVLKGNLKDLNEIPPCALVEAFARNLEHLPDKWHHTFIESCRTRLPRRAVHQDQEQEQKQEQVQEQTALPRVALNGKTQNEKLLKIAKEALSYSTLENVDLALDTFQSLYRHQHNGTNCPEADALAALTHADSERRTSNASH